MNDKPTWQNYLTPGHRDDDRISTLDAFLYGALVLSLLFVGYLMIGVFLWVWA